MRGKPLSRQLCAGLDNGLGLKVDCRHDLQLIAIEQGSSQGGLDMTHGLILQLIQHHSVFCGLQHSPRTHLGFQTLEPTFN